MKNLQQQNWPGSSSTILFSSDCSCVLFRHPCGDAAMQAEILGAAKRAEMVDVEQTKEIIPFVTFEVSFCLFGVNVLDLDFGVQIDSIEITNQEKLGESLTHVSVLDSCL